MKIYFRAYGILNPVFIPAVMKGAKINMASKKRQYEVDSVKKVVKANIAKLSPSELQAVNNYVSLGYALVDATIKPKTRDLFTKANIAKFLKANKEIKFDVKAYESELNEKGKKKGFINAQRAFRKLYEKEFLEFMNK